MFKKTLCGLTVATAAVGFVAWSVTAAPPVESISKKPNLAQADEIIDPNLNAAASSGPCGSRPCSYVQDFEAGWTIGATVVLQPAGAPPYELWDTGCGGTTASVASSANPFAGANHVRLSTDGAKPFTAFGCVVAARVPSSANAAANPVNSNVVTISQELAMSGFTGDYNVQPQAPSQALLTTRSMFLYYGLIIHLDDVGAGLTFISGGSWDTSGAYQNFTISFDPCTPEIRYNYGGVEVYNTTTGGSVDPIFGGTVVEQVLYYHDNAGGDLMDIDNVRIDRAGGPCPTTCGADGIEGPVEQCEIPAEGGDANCPGRCIAPGDTGPNGEAECTCIVACPDPCNACTFTNDVEAGEITTNGWYTFTASAPAYAFDSCGAAGYDSQISVWEGADCNNLTLIIANDDCDDSAAYGPGSDPLAPCFTPGGIASPFNSCTCAATTVGQQYWVWDNRLGGTAGLTQVLHPSKRNSCDALWGARGACCRGLTGTCEDDVAEASCNGAFDTFTLNKSCGTPEAGECVAVTGSCCDTLDGICQEGVTQAACQSPNVWTAGGTCSTCLPTLGACCDVSEGVCTENVARLACAEGDTWTAGATCAEVVCESPVIPTVSEWGLVIIALLLLSGAKVFFGRREVLA